MWAESDKWQAVKGGTLTSSQLIPHIRPAKDAWRLQTFRGSSDTGLKLSTSVFNFSADTEISLCGRLSDSDVDHLCWVLLIQSRDQGVTRDSDGN